MPRWLRPFSKAAGSPVAEPPGEKDTVPSSGAAGSSNGSTSDVETGRIRPPKWSFGVLNDTETDEVPGTVLLLSKETAIQPLGLKNTPARTSASSIPSTIGHGPSREPSAAPKKKTADGRIILDPQPSESPNDPLNWSSLRRDVALFSLGFYCMIGGGMTTILAAGFNQVSGTFDVSVPQVALTTGLYMMGLGVGGLLMSPTAILFGKRPVYLVTSLLFVGTSIWCASAKSYHSLLIARVFQGISISPVECLPSATIAEIFFLHERAYRLGIYSMLLLGGKNLVPLVSAVVVQAKGWRWVFWVVAMIVGGCFFLLFFFVPETFWNRTPRAHKSLHIKSRAQSFASQMLFRPPTDRRPSHLSERTSRLDAHRAEGHLDKEQEEAGRLAHGFPPSGPASPGAIAARRVHANRVGFLEDENAQHASETTPEAPNPAGNGQDAMPAADMHPRPELRLFPALDEPTEVTHDTTHESKDSFPWDRPASAAKPHDPTALQLPSPSSPRPETSRSTSFALPPRSPSDPSGPRVDLHLSHLPSGDIASAQSSRPPSPGVAWTHSRSAAPAKTYLETLSPWSGRLSGASWFRVFVRPPILFAYPAVLWSAVVYSLSVGWLIVLSESIAHIYQNPDSYNFTPLQTGLVYLSPCIGGVLGTVIAGKVSDLIVQRFAKANGGLYEPEFRLVMAIPVALATTIGLMGFGWSAEERDSWIVPTVFFGIISFGCTLGSTTAITFAVDSYRQYAGEALATLNFSKNIFHGLVFSLFFTSWLEDDGPRIVFIACGVIQMGCLLATIPMYIYGKRLRMWTVRKNFLEKF